MHRLQTILSTAWKLYQKQPVTKRVILLFLTPAFACATVIQDSISHLRDTDAFANLTLPLLLAMLGILLISTWGSACILLIGKRIFQQNAGRSKTSLRILAKAALPLVLPLFLTNLLRSCMTFLWALLFIVPGIIYYIRTAFYDVITVTEEKGYRPALRQSIEVVRGKTLHALLLLLSLHLVFLGPAYLISGSTDFLHFPTMVYPFVVIVKSFVMAAGTTGELLAHVALWKSLLKEESSSLSLLSTNVGNNMIED